MLHVVKLVMNRTRKRYLHIVKKRARDGNLVLLRSTRETASFCLEVHIESVGLLYLLRSTRETGLGEVKTEAALHFLDYLTETSPRRPIYCCTRGLSTMLTACLDTVATDLVVLGWASMSHVCCSPEGSARTC